MIRLLVRLRCALTDHDHVTVVRREPKADGFRRREVNRCRRGCGWEFSR